MSERLQLNGERSHLPPEGFLTAVALGGLGAMVAEHHTRRAIYVALEAPTPELPKTSYPEVILPAYRPAHRAVGSLAIEAARRRQDFGLIA